VLGTGEYYTAFLKYLKSLPRGFLGAQRRCQPCGKHTRTKSREALAPQLAKQVTTEVK
jgi:hypothetical protein